MDEYRVNLFELTAMDWITYDWEIAPESTNNDVWLIRGRMRTPKGATERQAEFKTWLDNANLIKAVEDMRYWKPILAKLENSDN